MGNFIKTAGREATKPDKFFWTIKTAAGKTLLEGRDLESEEDALADLSATIEGLAETVETSTVSELSNAQAVMELAEAETHLMF
jgi:hypothetical protein